MMEAIGQTVKDEIADKMIERRKPRMKKVQIRMVETCRYDREVVVSVPDHALDTIDRLLDTAEGQAEIADDVLYCLRENGCKVVNDFRSCPNASEVEITDYKILTES